MSKTSEPSIWKRNTDGIKAAAQRKSQDAFARTEKAIQTLIREQKPINFESVAKEAGVTRVWLYKQPDVRGRIESLRAQQCPRKAVPKAQSASDDSKDAMIKALRLRVKKLESENRELREQVEFAYGKLMQAESDS